MRALREWADEWVEKARNPFMVEVRGVFLMFMLIMSFVVAVSAWVMAWILHPFDTMIGHILDTSVALAVWHLARLIDRRTS